MSAPESGRASPERRLAELLHSMSADAPRPGAKRATLAALGLGTVAAATTGTAGAVGAGGLVKLASIGAICGFAMGGVALGVQYVVAPNPPSYPASAVAGAPAAPGALKQTMPQSFSVPSSSASVSEEVVRPQLPASPVPSDRRAAEPPEQVLGPSLEDRTIGRRSPAVATFEPTPASASLLREETRELDRARAAIVAGDAGAGLVALDRYAAAFPGGALAEEATLLRIKALVMSGDRARASALARSFMAARPRDPHIEELRSLLAP